MDKWGWLLGFLSGVMVGAIATITFPRAPELPKQTPGEYAALAMIRLGYDKWVVACAYTIAKDGGTAEAADKACRVNFTGLRVLSQ